MNIKRSLNEIEHTCRKAARGCGLPWGVADEVGKSVRWLHVFGLDGTRVLVKLLKDVDHHECRNIAPRELRGTWKAPGGVLSPLLVGPSLCDSLDLTPDREIETGPVAWPLLVAGFLGQSALEPSQAVCLRWSGVTLGLYRNVLCILGNRDDLYCESSNSLICARQPVANDTEPESMTIGDAEVEKDAWACLEQYAHLTYVAATVESRLSGAGAGLTDND